MQTEQQRKQAKAKREVVAAQHQEVEQRRTIAEGDRVTAEGRRTAMEEMRQVAEEMRDTREQIRTQEGEGKQTALDLLQPHHVLEPHEVDLFFNQTFALLEQDRYLTDLTEERHEFLEGLAAHRRYRDQAGRQRHRVRGRPRREARPAP